MPQKIDKAFQLYFVNFINLFIFLSYTLSLFVEHGIMAHNPWWLSQWKLLNCIIQWSKKMNDTDTEN